MGQDTTDTHLTTSAAASVRKPAIELWVDWADAGFVADADLAANWTDESAYVIEASGDMNSSGMTRSPALLGNGVVNAARVTLDNSTFRFSPSNTGGALYANIQNGKIHMKRAIVRAGFAYLTNLLSNPGFETAGAGGADVFANWTESAGDGAIELAPAAQAHGGVTACLLTSGASLNTSIYQQVTVVPLTPMTLTFWYERATEQEGSYAVYDVTNSADIIAKTPLVGDTSYEQTTATFTVPAGCVALRVIFYAPDTDGKKAYYDDVSLTVDKEVLRQITGYIVNATENYGRRTVQLEIRDRGADLALAKISTGPSGTYTKRFDDYAAKTYLDALVTQWNAANPGRDDIGTCDFDLGMFVTPYLWMHDETLWAELTRVSEAQMGRVWFDKDGVLHWEDGTHWATGGGDAWDDPTVVQATLEMAFRDVGPEYDYENVVNHVRVAYTPQEKQAVADVVYTLREVLVIPAGGTITHKAEMNGAVHTYGITLDGTVLPHTDEEDTSMYWSVTAGGTQINADVNITPAYYTESIVFTLENANTDYAAYVTKLEVTASNPFAEGETGWYEAEDATSLGLHGCHTLPIQNTHVQSLAHAKAIGDFALARLKDPVQLIRLGGVPARPWLETGDRIHVEDTAGSGVHGDYLVSRLAWRWGPKIGYVQDIEALQIADLFALTDWFVIGTSKYGSGAGHGHLFW